MARCCGSTGSCACRVTGGRGITIRGTGSSQDPFVVESDRALDTQDNDQFNLILTGAGTLASPWLLEVQYAATADLNGLPDVDTETTAPTNGQVLAWNDSQQKWLPAAPTTAAAGSVTVGNGINGNGSAGTPLVAKSDTARYIQVSAAGLGLSDAGINRMLRMFATDADRNATTIAPETNTLSIVATRPGRIDYWDGDSWEPLKAGIFSDAAGQLLPLSGNYPAGGQVTQYVRQIVANTDANGVFDVIPAANLAGYSGVLSAHVQPVGGTPWTCMVLTATNKITGVARRVDDGTPYAGFTINATVTALLY